MKWSTDAFWLKAKAYADRANEFSQDRSDFPLWSALALELLARAALTKIHPALNADPRDDVNLLYACGFQITEQPRSLPAHSVFLRLEKTVAGFGKVQRELCDYLALLRNDELHSADLPFESLKESKWLPRYYETCNVLCAHMGKSLEDFLGTDVATAAEKLIRALSKELESAVKSRIAAHAKGFQEKPEPERAKLRDGAQAHSQVLAYTHASQLCPACGSKGLLRGELIKELKPLYEDEALLIDQELLAVEFRCPACELVLHSPEEIAHTAIEPRFRKRRETDLHELFEADYGDEYMNM